MIDKYYSLLYNDYKIKKKRLFIMEPVIIPDEITIPKQKIFFDTTSYKLDERANSFIESVVEKGFKIISITVNANQKDYYTTTIIYG
jgi:hypothetical protein